MPKEVPSGSLRIGQLMVEAPRAIYDDHTRVRLLLQGPAVVNGVMVSSGWPSPHAGLVVDVMCGAT